jgi:hypothetical protein
MFRPRDTSEILRHTEKPLVDSRGLRDVSRRLLTDREESLVDSRGLRDVSRRLLEHVDRLRRLEQESRVVAIGSPEFVRLSREVAAASRKVSRLAGEQLAVGVALSPRATTIEELDEIEGQGDPRSRSV